MSRRADPVCHTEALSKTLCEFRFDPAPNRWVLGRRTPGAAALRFREQLGLSAHGPLVLSGHQAELWHGGILAKHFAAAAFAAKTGAATGWIVVDQDEAEDPSMAVPVRDQQGRLRTWRWRWAESIGRVACGLAPVKPPEPRLEAGLRWANESIADRVEVIRRALLANASAPNWAEQVSQATGEMIGEVAPAPRSVYESRLGGTDLFASVVAALVREASGAMSAYNRAIAEAGDSGMRPLDERIGELPLWAIKNGRRMRVLATEAGALDPTTLAPRGMLMTALLRLAGCELFVHGVGGGAYDRATERWVAAWTGELGRIASDFGGAGALAPMVVATADLRLPLAASEVPSEEEIARGVWRAHHARHDPAMLGDATGAEEKAGILERIRARKSANQSPAPEFAELHALLERSRSRRGQALESLRAAAARLKEQQQDAAVAHARTWSFALQPPGALRSMFDQTQAAFGKW